MSDEHWYPLTPDDAGRHSQNGALPAEALSLDDLLRRDGMLWRDSVPSDRRLAQLARQLAAFAGPATLPPPELSDAAMHPALEPASPSYPPASLRFSRRANRWRTVGAVAAAMVIVGLLATLLHGLAGSRATTPTALALAGDCSQVSKTAPSPVNWPQFSFGASGGRCNPYESRLSPTTARELTLAWHAPGQFIDSSPAVVAGRIYVASIYPDSKLYVFDADTGKQIWATPDGQPVETSSTSPAVANGMVLLGVGHDLEAFDAASGRLAWKFTASGLITTSPTIADGVVYVAFQDQNAYAFDARTGQQIWKASLGGTPVPGPIAVASHLVYVSANALYALDRATGAIRWSAGADPLNAPVVADNTVYASGSDFRIHAFQADSGSPIWTSAPLDNVVASPVGVVRGQLYTGDADGAFWMLDGKTGSRHWSAQLPDSSIVFSSPAIANGVVYVTGSCDCGSSDAHFIFALRATDGGLLWQFAPGYPVYTSPVVANGILYVATYKGLDAFSIQ